MIFRKTEQIPFDLKTNEAIHPALFESDKLVAEQSARREMKRLAREKIFIAQDPAHIRLPGQDPEGRGVGDDDEVWRPRHLIEVHAAAAGKRSKRPGARSVECRRSDVNVVSVFQRAQESWNGNRLRARSAVRVGPCDAEKLELVFLDPCLNFFGETVLVVLPQ